VDLTTSTLRIFNIGPVTEETTKKSTKIRADAKPTEGYILTVDGKLKTSYETEQDAAVEAAKLKQRFPVLQVSVYEAREGIYAPVDMQEQ
jgi:hypothetical protein